MFGADLAKPLSESERDELEELMETRSPDGAMRASITFLHGFLTNIVSGPMVQPSGWIPQVFDGPDECAWTSIEQARRAHTLLMRFYNEAASNLQREDGGFTMMIDYVGDKPDAVVFAGNWARGYLYGIAVRRNEWAAAMRDIDLAPRFGPILALASDDDARVKPFDDPQASRALLEEASGCVVDIYDWWRDRPAMLRGTVRRASPKVSPNAPCPCGSGKKYKRCCSPLSSA